MIEARGLEHLYPGAGQPAPALRGIDLSISRGEMVAIQGPSGSGKSTLLYLLGCLLRVQRGQLRIDGADLLGLSEAQLALFRNRKIGFVFQQFHLLPRASVLENILLPAAYPSESARLSPGDLERATRLATTFGLEDRLRHTPSQLSGGQQQRVAIARALMKDPPLLLADEPTGNLDSRNAAQVLELLRSLQREGRTVVIITHDAEVAARCDRSITLRDGTLALRQRLPALPEAGLAPLAEPAGRLLPMVRALLPAAAESLARNRLRSFLTMLGITIGIAAVLSMLTLGQFTKWKILDSYAELGVNNLAFYGYPNWDLKATDAVSVPYRGFEWKRDLIPLLRIFPQIERMSPDLMSWRPKIRFAGREFRGQTTSLVGVNEHALSTHNRRIAIGSNFTGYHMSSNSPVCLVGWEIAQQLLGSTLPVGQVLDIESQDKKSFPCRVIGVLRPVKSQSEWIKPDSQILLPYTYFQAWSDWHWEKTILRVNIRLHPGSDVEKVGRGIRSYFEQKYGKAGKFRVDSDSVLVSQMKKFLTLFSILLAMIALLSLAVGGVGIANMMLVSVTERYREIGLRKALGATPRSIRLQLLLESVLICALAGALGILLGAVAYHAAILGATKLIPKLEFEWTIDWLALALSLLSIVAVGVLSGIFPALKAERLQVIEAMRSE